MVQLERPIRTTMGMIIKNFYPSQTWDILSMTLCVYHMFFISSEIMDFSRIRVLLKKAPKMLRIWCFGGKFPNFRLLGVFFKQKRHNVSENIPNFTFLKCFGDIF